jgi:DNA topoisomerase VI subunit A
MIMIDDHDHDNDDDDDDDDNNSEIYYNDASLFLTQNHSNSSISSLCTLLQRPRALIGVIAATHGMHMYIVINSAYRNNPINRTCSWQSNI